MTPEFQLCEAAKDERLEEYVAERKLDGTRIMSVDGKLINRRGRNVTDKFPEIDVPEETVDGEIITDDFDFNTLLRRLNTEDRYKIREVYPREYTAYFVAFDVLEVDGEDLTDLSLLERKERLDVSEYDNVMEITTRDDPEELWDEAMENNWEGIILKDPESTYDGDRSDTWLKMKYWKEELFDVVGTKITENDGFVVLVDVEDDEPQKVVVNGHDDQEEVERGVDQVEIQFLEKTESGRLRKPSFKGSA